MMDSETPLGISCSPEGLLQQVFFWSICLPMLFAIGILFIFTIIGLSMSYSLASLPYCSFPLPALI